MKTESSVFNFLLNGDISSDDGFFYCQTRDQASARLLKWMDQFKTLGLTVNQSAILTAILGEVTNNSFDHNLGNWNDNPGCIVAFDFQPDHLTLYIADRGQGIISSLGKSLTEKLSPELILKKAFEERISGRSPEKRGNGLKFVLKHIQESKSSLYCFSQGSHYSTGHQINIPTNINLPQNFGTLVIIQWRLK